MEEVVASFCVRVSPFGGPGHASGQGVAVVRYLVPCSVRGVNDNKDMTTALESFAVTHACELSKTGWIQTSKSARRSFSPSLPTMDLTRTLEGRPAPERILPAGLRVGVARGRRDGRSELHAILLISSFTT